MSSFEDVSSLTDGLETCNIGKDLQGSAHQLHLSLNAMQEKRLQLETELTSQQTNLQNALENQRKMTAMLDSQNFHAEEMEEKVGTTRNDLSNLRVQAENLRERLKAEKAKQFSQMIESEAKMELLTKKFMAAPEHYTDRPRLSRTISELRNECRRNREDNAVVRRELAHLEERYALENPDAPITRKTPISDANIPAVLEDTVEAAGEEAGEREKELKKQRKELENSRQINARLSNEIVNIRTKRNKQTAGAN